MKTSETDKTEIVTFRLTPEIKYLAELASRKFHMNFSDFIRLCVSEKANEKPQKTIEQVKEYINRELNRYSLIISARTISDYENGEINIMKLLLKFIDSE